MSSRLPLVLLAAVFVVVFSRPARASTVTAMEEETLVRLSAVIVRGEVEMLSVAADARGDVQTWVTIRVEESLKGADGRSRVAVSVPGGTWGDRVSQVFGVPRFRIGERVVVFAAPTKSGLLTVTGLFQGKYRIEKAAGAVEEAVPDEGQGAEVMGGGARRVREPLAPFLARLRDLVGRHPGRSLPDTVVSETPAGAGPTVSPFFTLTPLIPFRYFEPDSGLPVSFRFNPAGAPVAVAIAQAGFAAARRNWTDVTGASIAVEDGGATTQACRILFDGSVISHGDPCGQMPAFDPTSCSGVLAITGVSGFTLERKTVNGVTFLRMTEADTVFNADTECFYAGPDAQKNYEEVLTHEMGHGLGLGHSCGDVYSGDCVPGTEEDDALMRAFAHGGGRGGTPHADDIDGIRFIYPTPGFIDLQISANTFHTGQTLSLKADLNGTASSDFYLLLVYPAGFFVSVAPGLPLNTVAPAATGVPLAFATDVPLVNYTWTGTEPAGSYLWFAILTRAGTDVFNTSNWLSFDSAVFTFTP